MAIGYGSTIRNTRLNQLRDAIDAGGAGGKLKFYTATRPATGAAITTQTLLATLTFSFPSAPSASDGVLSFGTISGPVTATGTTTWARIETSAGAFVADLSVTATGGGGDITLGSTSITSGDSLSTSSATLTDTNVLAPQVENFAFSLQTLPYTFSNGNNKVTANETSSIRNSTGNVSKNAGKLYFEVVLTKHTYLGAQSGIGVCRTSKTNTTAPYAGTGSIGGFCYLSDGYKGSADSNNVSFSAESWSQGDVIGVAIDLDTTGRIWYARNNVWQAGGDPAADTGHAQTTSAGQSHNIMINPAQAGDEYTVLVGDGTPSALTYTPPSGFSAWSATNVDMTSSHTQGFALSNGDRTVTASGDSNFRSSRGNLLRNSGKRYFEVNVTTLNTATFISTIGAATLSLPSSVQPYINANSYVYNTAGNVYMGTFNSLSTSGFVQGDKVMMAVDFDAGKIWFGRNGTWLNAGNPGAGTNQSGTFTANTMLAPIVNPASNGGVMTIVLGDTDSPAFTYTVPSGFTAWGVGQ